MENIAKLDGAWNSRETTHDSASKSTRRSRFPTGYRFMPTDQELIVDYLAKKVKNEPIQVSEMSEVHLYKCLPEYLVENYPRLGDKEWYFFTPRDRKYPNGSRPSRSVKEEGYWKATGIDKAIFSANGEIIGKKRALVFYVRKSKPKNANKTDWIMHEYRLNTPSKSPGCNEKRLDDWVLCRIYKKPERSKKKKKDGDDRLVDDEDDIFETPFLAEYNNIKHLEALDIHEKKEMNIVEDQIMVAQDKSVMIVNNNVDVGDVNFWPDRQFSADNTHNVKCPYGFNTSLHEQNGNFHHGSTFYDPWFENSLNAIVGSYTIDAMGFLWSVPNGIDNYLPIEDMPHFNGNLKFFDDFVKPDEQLADDCVRPDEGQNGMNQNPDFEKAEPKKR